MMDTLPRVPDVHGGVVDEKLYSDLYTRTSWVDASTALDQIEKVSRHSQSNQIPRRGTGSQSQANVAVVGWASLLAIEFSLIRNAQ